MEMGWNLRRLAYAIAFSSIFLTIAPRAPAQVELITFDHPFEAQKLAGVALDASGASVIGVLVEDCDSTFKRVLASAWTDENGHFAFRRAKTGTTHYLRISKGGFDPMHIEVRVTNAGEPDLKIQLHIAT